MKKVVLFVFVSVFMSSCFHDNYIIQSPNKKESLFFEYTSSIVPNESKYVKIFYGSNNLKKDEYIKMIINSGGIDVNWGTRPITIIGNPILRNTIPNKFVKIKNEMSNEEIKDFHTKKTMWKSYDFTMIINNGYIDCKKLN